jgi:hypothetical protein
MPADVLEAMEAIAREGHCSLRGEVEAYKIRINSEGALFEYYIKDALTGGFYGDEDSRIHAYRQSFAWLGNQNNPPDAIARQGDAFEIKKLLSPKNSIALNSSPPKDMLHSNDARIVTACRNSDGGKWAKKDIFYVIGWIESQRVRSIYFVQGSCYAASREVYESISTKLSENISEAISSSGLDAGKTDELGRINRVDPLGITSLRVRGMWQIENPSKVFQKVARIDPAKKFQAFSIMKWEKYLQMLGDRQNSLPDAVKLSRQRIPDPNNPAEEMDAVVLEVSWA